MFRSIIRSAPVPTHPHQHFIMKNFKPMEKLKECSVNIHLPTTQNLQLIFCCTYFIVFIPSLHLIFSQVSEYTADISTLQSYTLNVNIIRYSLIFAYGSLPGIFFKIKFPSAITEFLMQKGGGEPRTFCFEKAPGLGVLCSRERLVGVFFTTSHLTPIENGFPGSR